MRRVYGGVLIVLAVLAISGGGTGLAEQATPCATNQPAAQAVTFHGSGSQVTDVFTVVAPLYKMHIELNPGDGTVAFSAYNVETGELITTIPIALLATASSVDQVLSVGSATRVMLNVESPGVGWVVTLTAVH